MCCPAGKWHRRMMALLKSVAAFVLLLSWVAQYADFEHRRHVDLEHNFKWYTSEEASQEVRGFHHYVAALASHDMPLDKPVFLDAALGLGLGPDTLNVSQMPLTGLTDLRAFFWSVHAEDTHRLVRREPAHWGSLADLVVSGSTVGSRRQGEPFLSGGLLGGGLLGGAPKRAQEPAAGWCATRHRPRKPAQSGYRADDGLLYCKACLQELFPAKYAEKRAGKACRSESRLLVVWRIQGPRPRRVQILSHRA